MKDSGKASFDQGPEKRAKPLVVLCFRSKVLKKHWFYCVFAQKGWKTIGFIVKMQKSEKTIGFTMKKIQKEQKPL